MVELSDLQVSRTIVVEAPPAKVYEIIADVTGQPIERLALNHASDK